MTTPMDWIEFALDENETETTDSGVETIHARYGLPPKEFDELGLKRATAALQVLRDHRPSGSFVTSNEIGAIIASAWQEGFVIGLRVAELSQK